MPYLSSVRYYKVVLFSLQICKFDRFCYPFFGIVRLCLVMCTHIYLWSVGRTGKAQHCTRDACIDFNLCQKWDPEWLRYAQATAVLVTIVRLSHHILMQMWNLEMRQKLALSSPRPLVSDKATIDLQLMEVVHMYIPTIFQTLTLSKGLCRRWYKPTQRQTLT